MEWSSVGFLVVATLNAVRILRRGQNVWSRAAWIIFILIIILFIGEEISWGERIHGFGVEAIRSMNTQEETSLHNIAIFQESGLLHAGWVVLGLILGLGGWIWRPAPLLPDRRLCLYFLLPAVWYFGMEVCRNSGSCTFVFVGQEIYEFLVALGLYLHSRMCLRQWASGVAATQSIDP